MPNVTIYVDRDLAAAIAKHKIPTSKTCQAGLRRAVRVAERRAEAEAMGRAHPGRDLADGAPRRQGA